MVTSLGHQPEGQSQAHEGRALRRVVEALETKGYRRSGRLWSCPAHDDRNPSLSVDYRDGKVLLHCFAGCEVTQILAKLGLELSDLFDAPPGDKSLARTRRPSGNRKPNGHSKPRPVAFYLYVDRHGKPLARKVRYEPGFGEREKSFSWEHPLPGGNRWAKPDQGQGNPKVLYNLPAILEAETIVWCEGEKAVDRATPALPIGWAATCHPAWAQDLREPWIVDPLRAKRVLFVQDRDDTGRKRARQVVDQLGELLAGLRVVQSKTTSEGDDLFDHLEAGHDIQKLDPVPVELSPSVLLRQRFSPQAMGVADLIALPPSPREWLFEELLARKQSGLVVGEGGVGKGFAMLHMALALATGEPFGPFSAQAPAGVMLVSREDDRSELHRRLYAAIQARWGIPPGGLNPSARGLIEQNLFLVDLFGLPDAVLGDELVAVISESAKGIPNLGLIVLDPLGKLLPKDADSINSQEGAGAIHARVDQLVQATGSTILLVHHVNKDAIRQGTTLGAEASTGSRMLVDLARTVMNLAPLGSVQARELHGIDCCETSSFVQVKISKANYSARSAAPFILKRGEGGALLHVAVRPKAEVLEDRVFRQLLSFKRWAYRDEWDERCKEREGVNRDHSRRARRALIEAKKVVARPAGKVRRGKPKSLFAPAEHLRPADWAPHPADGPNPEMCEQRVFEAERSGG
jgi:hypothetical protein